MKSPKVLLVDDEEEFTSALAERLNLRGFATSVSSSGDEALKAIDADPPQVIILDMMMPGLSGEEVLKQIKNRHPGIGVILLTGQVSPLPDHSNYLIKPVKIEELVERIRSVAQCSV